jgi:hypothetical protein
MCLSGEGSQYAMCDVNAAAQCGQAQRRHPCLPKDLQRCHAGGAQALIGPFARTLNHGAFNAGEWGAAHGDNYRGCCIQRRRRPRRRHESDYRRAHAHGGAVFPRGAAAWTHPRTCSRALVLPRALTTSWGCCLLFAGTYISNRTSDKIAALADHVYLCRSGSAADTQAVSDIGGCALC